MAFAPFPVEIWQKIFANLPSDDRLRISAVCKCFRDEFDEWRDVHTLLLRQKVKAIDAKRSDKFVFEAASNVAECGKFSIIDCQLFAQKCPNLKKLLFFGWENEPKCPIRTPRTAQPMPIEFSKFIPRFRHLQWLMLSNFSYHEEVNYERRKYIPSTRIICQLLRLPNLRILYLIEQYEVNLEIDPDSPTTFCDSAPIEELHLTGHSMQIGDLATICRTVKETLTVLNLNITVIRDLQKGEKMPEYDIYSNPVAPASELSRIFLDSKLQCLRLHYKTMMENFDHYYASILLPPTLKKLSVEYFILSNMATFVNNILPQSCTLLIIEAPLHTNGAPLVSFDYKNMILENLLSTFSRPINIQFGHINGIQKSPDIDLHCESRRIVAELSLAIFGDEKRFIVDNRNLSYSEFMILHNISL